MTTLAFDTLRYARRLKEVGVPEPQAEVQAELMAEAFGFYADNLLKKDHFTEVLDARFAEFDAKIEARFAEHDAKIEKSMSALEYRLDQRFNRQEVNQRVLAWMMGVVVVAVVLPLLQSWLT
jgi:hypothetical protein